MPPLPLEGKAVLSIGEGSGETAWPFFRHGARKVIGIEPNRDSAKRLRHNARHNSWNLEVIEEAFKVEHLELEHDFIKIDCEGGELVLLDNRVTRLRPCRMEFHPTVIGERNAVRLVSKFGSKRIGGWVWGSD